MNHTVTFFLSALSSLIIFTLINDGSSKILTWARVYWPDIAIGYDFFARMVIVITLISIFTLVFLLVERFFQDRSQFKYSDVLAALNRKIATVAREIDISSTDQNYWKKATDRVLKQIHDSFGSVSNPQVPG